MIFRTSHHCQAAESISPLHTKQKMQCWPRRSLVISELLTQQFASHLKLSPSSMLRGSTTTLSFAHLRTRTVVGRGGNGISLLHGEHNRHWHGRAKICTNKLRR